MRYEFDAVLWQWQARTDSWTFVSLPLELADEVLDVAGPVTRGFGSVRVEVTVGSTTWRTSIFPDAKAGTYVLPIKKAVRRAEGLTTDGTLRLTLTLVDL
jgi:hypothetical protein